MKAVCALFALSLLTAGCAYDPIAYKDLNDHDRGAEAALDSVLDPFCPIGGTELHDEPAARLWRAHLLIGVIARYGAARTEDYSDDKAGDSGRILARTQIALKALKAAIEESQLNVKLYSVKRADLILAMLDQADAAAKPTIRTVIGFLRVPSITGARELIRNAFEDRLFGKAYVSDCAEIFKGMKASGTPKKIDQKFWTKTDAHLKEQCTRLNQMAKTELKCELGIKPGT